MDSEQPINSLINHLFRVESGKMVAVLSRLFGFQKFDIAQDLVQDTLLAAMQVWPYKGIPENPSAWLMQTAKNKAIDYFRKQKRQDSASPEYAYLLQSEYSLGYTVGSVFEETEIEDNLLRMIFACSHPAIPEESQIALILKTLCGLGVDEIAKAFLTQPETIAKRIFRAKEKIKLENIKLEFPAENALKIRLKPVLKVLYLVFNEGYYATNPNYHIRENLCEDAMRLCYLLVQNAATATPETKALMALMCLQSARFNTRTNASGQIVLLKNQDRSLWHRGLMQQGYLYLEQASEESFNKNNQTQFSPYHLEAAIASIHASSTNFESTDWAKIADLYDALFKIQPNNIVVMNKAVALAYSGGPEKAIELLLAIDNLKNNPIYHTVLGEVFFKLGNIAESKIHFLAALELNISDFERQVILEKLEDLNK